MGPETRIPKIRIVEYLDLSNFFLVAGGGEEEVVGWCTAAQFQTCSTSELSVVGACRDLDQASRSTHRVLVMMRFSRATRKKLDGSEPVDDPDLWDSRPWAHNLSARLGLEVRGASQTMI